MSASEPPIVGQQFGRFRVVAPLGQGGLATVWRARDELLGREVALKILDRQLMQSAKARRRFIREAQAASLLDHPAIVTIFDAGETDDQAWIALTLVEGHTVSELASQRLMPVAEAVRIASFAGDALAHAHAHGVIHRDVTSRNIMVARDLRVYVLDFGLALLAGHSRLTTTNTTLGTIAYMAPEAITARGVDERGDIYGLGVVLFEALTGALPFRGERAEELAFAKLNEHPRGPRDLRPAVPEALDVIVRRAIARDPDARFGSMTDMVGALRSLALPDTHNGHGGSSPVAPAPQRPVLVPDSRDDTLPDPIYLLIRPFTVTPAEAGDAEGSHELGTRLMESLALALGTERRVRIVTTGSEAPTGSEPSGLISHFGANALLTGTIRQEGMRVRVTWTLHAADGKTQLTGRMVDGSNTQLFELEDTLAASVRHALGLQPGPPGTTRPRPPDPAAQDRYRLARGYLDRHDHQGNVDGAIQVLERLAQSIDARADHVATLGRAYLMRWKQDNERHDEALAARQCERALALDPDEPEALLLKAELHEYGGRVAEARAGYQAVLRLRPAEIAARLGLVRLLQQEQRWQQAEDECVALTAEFAHDWRPFMRLGLLRFARGEYEGCVSAWRHVIELVPDCAWGHRNLGSAFYHLDQFDEAIAAYQLALNTRPDAIAYDNLGTVFFYLGRFDEAVSMFERAIALKPADPLALGNLGNACRYIPGREASMRDALERAVALMRDRLDGHPQDAEGRARLAGWLMNLGRHDTALEELGRAISNSPDDVEVQARAGYVYADAGDRDAAIAWFRRAIDRGYGTRELERSPVLAALRQDPEFRQLLEESRNRSAVHQATRRR